MPSRKARGLCHCDSKLLADGMCQYRCSKYADPDWLRLQHSKRLERDAHRRREESFNITQEELRRMRRAVKRFDPVYRAISAQGRRAASKRYALRWSYAVGGAK